MKVLKILKIFGLAVVLLLAFFYTYTLIVHREQKTDNVVTENCNSQKAGNSLSINFTECKICQETVYVGFGSTKYEITKSKDANYCVISYGGEVENPNGNSNLNTTCIVPKNIGIKTFNITNYGVDFSSLAAYCK